MRRRTTLSASQCVALEKEFTANEYIDRNAKAKLAEELGLTEKQVGLWFRNRRIRGRKDRQENQPPMELLGTSFVGPIQSPRVPPIDCVYTVFSFHQLDAKLSCILFFQQSN